MDRNERFDDSSKAVEENDTSAAAIAFERIVTNCLELVWVVDPEAAGAPAGAPRKYGS